MPLGPSGSMCITELDKMRFGISGLRDGYLPTRAATQSKANHGGQILQGLPRPPQRPFPTSEFGCLREPISKTNYR